MHGCGFSIPFLFLEISRGMCFLQHFCASMLDLEYMHNYQGFFPLFLYIHMISDALHNSCLFRCLSRICCYVSPPFMKMTFALVFQGFHSLNYLSLCHHLFAGINIVMKHQWFGKCCFISTYFTHQIGTIRAQCQHSSFSMVLHLVFFII